MDKLRNVEPLFEPTAQSSRRDTTVTSFSKDDVTALSAEQVDKDHENVPSMLQQTR